MIKTPQNLQKVLPCLLGHLDHHLVDQRGHRQGGCHHLYIYVYVYVKNCHHKFYQMHRVIDWRGS